MTSSFCNNLAYILNAIVGISSFGFIIDKLTSKGKWVLFVIIVLCVIGSVCLNYFGRKIDFDEAQKVENEAKKAKNELMEQLREIKLAIQKENYYYDSINKKLQLNSKENSFDLKGAKFYAPVQQGNRNTQNNY